MGLLELLLIILAEPDAKSLGGMLINVTVEFGGHVKPAPRSVIVQVETSLAFKVRNNMASSWTPETDEMGVDSETRFADAHVVTNLYWKFGWRVNV